MSYAKKTQMMFFREIWPTTMFYANKTEITVFPEIWPDGHDLARKKRQYRLCVRFDMAAMILREKNRNYVFSWKLTRRPRFGAKKTEIPVMREIWPGGHDFAWKKLKLRFFVKIEQTTMI
jgi:hypothetical protein